MRYLLTGGRDFNDRELLGRAFGLHGINRKRDIVIHGGCRGLDKMADDLCKSRGIHTARVDARWGYYGNKSAGPIRNRAAILWLKPDAVLAFPTAKSKGTWNTVNIAKENGIQVFVYGHSS